MRETKIITEGDICKPSRDGLGSNTVVDDLDLKSTSHLFLDSPALNSILPTSVGYDSKPTGLRYWFACVELFSWTFAQASACDRISRNDSEWMGK